LCLSGSKSFAASIIREQAPWTLKIGSWNWTVKFPRKTKCNP
jgi:hypothetical protein